MTRPDGTREEQDRSGAVLQAFRRHRLDALIAVGGDGSLTIATHLHERGLRVVGVPKTIDNDLESTLVTFGLDSAVSFATECLDRLHATAQAHRRLMVVEVMGRSAGWIAVRDRWVGWSEAQRRRALPYVVNNSRLLILPWVHLPALASHLLGLAARRLAADWEARYGVRPLLLETLVDPARFRGTCYRAANWLPSGQPVGRGRMDRANVLAGHAPKTVYVYPLGRDIPARLCTAPAPRPLRGNRPGVFTVVRLPRAFSRPRLRDYALPYFAVDIGAAPVIGNSSVGLCPILWDVIQ